ncbi:MULTISPECIES: hypothetical protein [unclassified Sphingomonas]|uniref:hypothetical protein n=1 Tax=unclassified Sphingomonas TaxID=196159 RepID=UPI0006F4DF6B|nr:MULTISPECIES: hypothetical protein [unclassified Sphingomonas]KQM66718.1 hypothetical protein ASE65_01100 [Sphingomonas sp. Leaf16]KQN17666.1 hypothetical protein ASE81_00480 [Sphingomonas sp. Leaf29]KQN23933.1 hypothetical protein ASE83_03360 [Sphingomonas sp. Leaf32]
MTGFERRLALIAVLLLAGCDRTADPAVLANIEADQRAAADDAGRIECAAEAARPLAADCTIERTVDNDGTLLTLRQPDGGFHRLRIARDGRGVVAADGSEAAKVTVVGDDRIEVAIGGARYRLPATVGPVAR